MSDQVTFVTRDGREIDATAVVAALAASPKCHTCKRPLTLGESAWADDWTVLDPSTGRARREVRFTCDDCAAVKA